MSDLARRVIATYGSVHPSMYDRMRWRMSQENAEALADWFCAPSPTPEASPFMFGMPVDLVDSDEVLLVLVVT